MKQISVQKLEEWKSIDKDFLLIDVREEWEHKSFNIGGVLIPLGEIISRKNEVNQGIKTVVVYCKRGIRSQIAIQRLNSLFKEIEFYNLENGIIHLIS